MTDRLTKLRAGIDALDAQLISLLAERFALTAEVGQYKKQHALPACDPAREATQMARFASLAAHHQLDPALAQKVLRVVIDEVVVRHQQIQD